MLIGNATIPKQLQCKSRSKVLSEHGTDIRANLKITASSRGNRRGRFDTVITIDNTDNCQNGI